MNERYVFIDWMKTVAIFLVVLGHMPLTDTNLTHFIYSFHMPMFFCISGFLMKVDRKKQFLSDNVWCLLFPIIPYFLFYLLFDFAKDYFFYRNECGLEHNLLNPLYGLLTGNSHTPPLWFLLSLFWMRLTYYYSAQYIQKNHSVIMLLLSLSVAIVLWHMSFRCNLYNISSFAFGFPFFCLGAHLKNYNFNKIKELPILGLIALLLILGVVYWLVWIPNDTITLHSVVLGSSIIRYYVLGMLGTLFFYVCFARVTWLPKFVSTVSAGTLVIYSIHPVLIFFFKALYKKIFSVSTPPPYMDSLSAVVISAIIVALLYYPICKILVNKSKCVRLLAGRK